MAKEKNRNSTNELQKHVPYYYWLFAHAFVHGGAVALITGSVWWGMIEVFCHAIIDYGKCEKYYSIHHDQLLHLYCKIFYVCNIVQ